MIFGFAGKMGSGKNYVSEKIFIPLFEKTFPNRKILPVAFADQLKINTIVKYNLNRNDVYNIKPPSVRNILQREGTENGRDKLGSDIWIRYLSEWMFILEEKGITDFVITDCRFQNEVNWIKTMNGKIIRVELDNLESIYESNVNTETKNHISETELDNYNTWDLFLLNKMNNESNIQLEKQIHDFLNTLNTG